MSSASNIQLPFTTSHAFIIGINDYKHLSPLSTAVRDAEVLAEVLAHDHGYQVYPPLLNASKAQLTKLLTKVIPSLTGAEDRILFYFAGHGIALDSDDDPKGYLVPADAEPGDNTTLLPMAELQQTISNLSCKHGLLILDCCFAGAFKWSTGFRDVVFDLPGIIYEERFYQYAQDAAWQVITSSASDQKAVDILSNRTLGMRDDSAAEHSPFAAALLAGLAGEADTIPKERGDGVITATELYTYLRDRVEDETTEQGKRQSPSMFSLQKHDKGQYIFLHPRHPLNLPPIPDRNPFMGLKSYNEEDNSLFYGRDRAIAALATLIDHQPLVVVSGASGTGKSSVIKAGLLPELRSADWQILPVVRPGKAPIESLQESLPDGLPQITQPTVLIVDQYEELITQCQHPEDRIAFEQQLAQWMEANSQLHIIISIHSDFEPQFEEGELAHLWQAGRYVVPAFSQDELREVIIKPTVQEVLFFEPDSLVDKLVDAVNQAPGALPLLSFTLSELYHAYINSGRTNRAFTLADYEQLGGVIGALRTRANSIYDGLDQAHQNSMRKLMLRMVSLEGGELASRRVVSEDLAFSNAEETSRMKTVAQKLVAARLVSTGLDQNGLTYYEPAHDALVRAWARLWEWIKAQGEGKLSLMYKLSLAVDDHQLHQGRAYLWHDDPRLDLMYADLLGKDHTYNQQEESFLQESYALRRRNQRRRWVIIAGVFAGLVGLAIYAFYQQEIANTKTIEALAAQRAAQDSARVASEQRNLANLKVIEAQDSAASARAQREVARTKTIEALQSATFARVQQGIAEQKAQEAQDSATVAQEQRRIAIRETRQAQAAALSAKARQIYPKDNTIALNLAYAAFRTTPTEESANALGFILNNESSRFAQDIGSFEHNVTALGFSPDDALLYTLNEKNKIIVTDLQNEERVNEFDLKGIDASVFWVSPSGQQLAILEDSSSIYLISPTDGSIIHKITGHQRAVHSISFSRDGKRLISCSADKTIRVWSTETAEELLLIEGHYWDVYTAIYSADEKWILSASGDKTIRLWSAETGEEIQRFEGHENEVFDADISPDNEKIINSSCDVKMKSPSSL